VRTLNRGDPLGSWKSDKQCSRHGVRFADAALVFEDPVAITLVDDESDPIEQRFVVLGADAAGQILVVVYSWRVDDIRLISARRAEPHEREEYENQ
jgi:uncharacterized DUF497 family protein